MERPLIADPNDYEAKPIAGSLDARGLVTIAAVALACAPVVIAIFAWGLDSTLGSLIAMAVGSPIGYIGFARYKNLRFEEFAPLILRERMKPEEMDWEAPQPVFPAEAPKQKQGRKERKASELAGLEARYEDHLWAAALATGRAGNMGITEA